MIESITLTKGSESAIVEISEKGWYTALTVNGQLVVSARIHAQDKIDAAILALFMQGWKFTGGESLSYTTRVAIGEAIQEGYTPIQVGELVFSLKNLDLHEKSRMILYSSQTLAGLKREGKTNTRWGYKSLQLVRWDAVERFVGLLAAKFAKA